MIQLLGSFYFYLFTYKSTKQKTKAWTLSKFCILRYYFFYRLTTL